MYCEYCGNKIEYGQAVCPVCGNQIIRIPHTAGEDETTVLVSGEEPQDSIHREDKILKEGDFLFQEPYVVPENHADRYRRRKITGSRWKERYNPEYDRSAEEMHQGDRRKDFYGSRREGFSRNPADYLPIIIILMIALAAGLVMIALNMRKNNKAQVPVGPENQYKATGTDAEETDIFQTVTDAEREADESIPAAGELPEDEEMSGTAYDKATSNDADITEPKVMSYSAEDLIIAAKKMDYNTAIRLKDIIENLRASGTEEQISFLTEHKEEETWIDSEMLTWDDGGTDTYKTIYELAGGEDPIIEYTLNGASGYAYYIDSEDQLHVYISTSEDRRAYEIYPEVCGEYKFE